MPRRGRSKTVESKPEVVPEKLARPFEAAMKAIKAQQKATAEAEAERARAAATARADSTPKPPAAKPSPSKAPAKAPTKQAATSKRADPIAAYGYDDRVAFHQAFADVRPMADKRAQRRSGQVAPISADEKRERAAAAARANEAEEAARARLDALVAGSARFFVDRDRDGAIYGRRSDVSDRMLDTITGPKVAPRVSLDLHGADEATARRETQRFLREQSERGVRDVLIVHGKGLHSGGGIGVLADVVVRVLTESPIAPKVVAFASAPVRLGGLGAMVVRLDPAR